MTEEKIPRGRRRKHLLDWKPIVWQAGGWTLKEVSGDAERGVYLYDGKDKTEGELITKFLSVPEAQDYAEAIEGHRRRWLTVRPWGSGSGR